MRVAALLLKDGRPNRAAVFNFATMQNPNREIRSGTYYNNFHFISSPLHDQRWTLAEEETSAMS